MRSRGAYRLQLIIRTPARPEVLANPGLTSFTVPASHAVASLSIPERLWWVESFGSRDLLRATGAPTSARRRGSMGSARDVVTWEGPPGSFELVSRPRTGGPGTSRAELTPGLF